VRNHLVILSPNCLETCVTVESLKSLLHLGTAFVDKSSVEHICVSVALKLCSLSNCFTCLDAHQIDKFMFLLPWELQEEGVRNHSYHVKRDS
jgi:hypothetical protein